MKLRKNADWLEAKVDDGMLMMHSDSGRFVSLNESGTFLWSCLDDPRDPDELTEMLNREFDVTTAQASLDVATWISEMSEHHVVEQAPG